MPRSNRALKNIDDTVPFQSGFVDRKSDLYFSVEDQTITMFPTFEADEAEDLWNSECSHLKLKMTVSAAQRNGGSNGGLRPFC